MKSKFNQLQGSLNQFENHFYDHFQYLVSDVHAAKKKFTSELTKMDTKIGTVEKLVNTDQSQLMRGIDENYNWMHSKYTLLKKEIDTDHNYTLAQVKNLKMMLANNQSVDKSQVTKLHKGLDNLH